MTVVLVGALVTSVVVNLALFAGVVILTARLKRERELHHKVIDSFSQEMVGLVETATNHQSRRSKKTMWD